MVWATDSESEQRRIAERMRAQDVAVYCHSVAGMTILEGVDPDGSRVVVACPGPGQMPAHISRRACGHVTASDATHGRCTTSGR